jgi:hypothetical protein
VPESTDSIIKAPCPFCGTHRNAFIRKTYTRRVEDHENEFVSIDNALILECCGCEGIFFIHEYQDCESLTEQKNPETGQLETVPERTLTVWPTPKVRVQPAWMSGPELVEDDVLRTVLDELYTALNARLRILAAVGARTALDRAAVLVDIDPALSFEAKLDRLVEQQQLSGEERRIVKFLVDVGNASAHRAWKPSMTQLTAAIDILETFLRHTALRPAYPSVEVIDRLGRNVPKRPRRPNKDSTAQ